MVTREALVELTWNDLCFKRHFGRHLEYLEEALSKSVLLRFLFFGHPI
jgi:hypothetical protein